MRALRVFGSHNPSGIVTNEGWIALAACVYGGLSADKALYKVCGLQFQRVRQDREGSRKMAKIIMEAYRANPEASQYQIATQVGCSRSMVAYVLCKNNIYRRKRKAAIWHIRKSKNAESAGRPSVTSG